MKYIERVSRAADFIKGKIDFQPEIDIIIGTVLGRNSLLKSL